MDVFLNLDLCDAQNALNDVWDLNLDLLCYGVFYQKKLASAVYFLIQNRHSHNYNKFPGPEFKQIGSQVLTEEIEFNLVENYREAFDVTAFNQRFSEILTKFDFIVGDWGNDQLRLRGFYQDEKAKESDFKISRLEDYLLEYCNYGCAYFVLENLQPKRASFDKKSRSKREQEQNSGSASKRSRSRRSRRRNDQSRDNRQNKPKEKVAKEANRHFVIRQK